MIAKDLRQFIKILDKTGDLLRIKEQVHWDLEIGAISRRAYELQGPAVLFEKIKDYPAGYRVLNGMTGTFRRVAIAMGLSSETPVKEIYAEFGKRMEHPVKPRLVKEGPCQEKVFTGDRINIYDLPSPYLHEGDGGRYIGTWDVVVSRDPDSGWTNWGMYRFMVHNQRYITGDARKGSDLGIVLHGKYVPQNKPMPVAVVLGADPLSHMVATSSFGIGVDEADYSGALAREPVELVKCITSPILVPAKAEVVIEGEILPDKIAAEGPFGEYPGYRSYKVRSGMLCRVTAITYRSSPISTTICLGIPPDDSSIAASLAAGWAMKRRLLRHQLPIMDVYVPPAGVTHLIAVSVKAPGGINVARQIRDVLTARRADVNKIVVVDEDVDVFNFDEVIHALATKCHPVRGIETREVEAGKANILTPCYTAEERSVQKGGVAVWDCTWPPDWYKHEDTDIPIKNSFQIMYPDKVKSRVLRRWKKYGFK